MYSVQKVFLLVSLIAISVKVPDVNGKGYVVFSMNVGGYYSSTINYYSYNISSGNLTKLSVTSQNFFGPMVTHQNKIYSITITFVLLRNVSEGFHTLATPLINHDVTGSNAYSNAVSIEVYGKIYVLGGYGNGGKGFERYDPCSGSWEVLPSSQMAHSGGSLAEIFGNIYACGGYLGTASNMCEYYSIHANVWELLNYPMLGSFPGSMMAAINDTLFAFQYTSDPQKFDFKKGKWEAIPKLPKAESVVNVAMSTDSDAIYVQTSSSIYRYDGNSTYDFLTANPPGFTTNTEYSNNLVYVENLPNYSCGR